MPKQKKQSTPQLTRDEYSPPSTPITSPIVNRLSRGSIDSPSPLNTSIALLRSDLVADLNETIENISLRDDYLSHSTLIEIIWKLGYNIDKDGVCHGFSNLAKNAILAGQFDKFEKRMNFINSNSPASIIKALRKVKHKLNNNLPLDKNDQNYLDLIVFFDNIVISQDPHKAFYLFSDLADLQQGSSASRKLVESETLAKKGGEVELIQIPAVFNKEELQAFLKSYEQICIDLKLTQPVTLQFGAAGHAVNVTYMPKSKEWIFVDANAFKNPRQNTNSKATQHFPNTLQVANILFNNYVNLVPNHNRSPIYLGMTIKASATGDNTQAINGFRSAIKNTLIYKNLSSPKNRQKAARVDIKNNNFLHIVGRLHKYPISLINFKEHKQNLDIQDDKGNTPLMIAMQTGHIDMAKALLNAGADPNIANNIGISPIYIAARKGQEELVNLLIQKKAKQELNVAKLIPYACENFDKDMLTFLCKTYGTDINELYPFAEKPRAEKTSTHSKYIQPLIYALNNNKLDLANFLIDIGANILFGIEWAIRQNNLKVFNLLLERLPGEKDSTLRKLFEAAVKAEDTEAISFLSKTINVNKLYLGMASPFGDILNQDEGKATQLIQFEMFTYLDFIKALYEKRQDVINEMLAHSQHLFRSLTYFENLSSEDKEKLATELPYIDLRALPIIIAVTQDNYELTEQLLAFEFTPNTKDPKLMPALHLAVQNENEMMVRLLLVSNANKKARYQNQNAHELALSQDNATLATLVKPSIKIRRRVSSEASPTYRVGSVFASPNGESPKAKRHSPDFVKHQHFITTRKKQRSAFTSPDPFSRVTHRKKG